MQSIIDLLAHEKSRQGVRIQEGKRLTHPQKAVRSQALANIIRRKQGLKPINIFQIDDTKDVPSSPSSSHQVKKMKPQAQKIKPVEMNKVERKRVQLPQEPFPLPGVEILATGPVENKVPQKELSPGEKILLQVRQADLKADVAKAVPPLKAQLLSKTRRQTPMRKAKQSKTKVVEEVKEEEEEESEDTSEEDSEDEEESEEEEDNLEEDPDYEPPSRVKLSPKSKRRPMLVRKAKQAKAIVEAEVEEDPEEEEEDSEKKVESSEVQITQLLNNIHALVKVTRNKSQCLINMRDFADGHDESSDYFNLASMRTNKKKLGSKRHHSNDTWRICADQDFSWDQNFGKAVKLFGELITLAQAEKHSRSDERTPEEKEIDEIYQNKSDERDRDSVSKETKQAIFAAAHGICFCCEKKLDVKKTSTYDFGHIVPCREGGEETEDNLVLACHRCNEQMGTQHLFEFMLREGNESDDPRLAAFEVIFKKYRAQRKLALEALGDTGLEVVYQDKVKAVLKHPREYYIYKRTRICELVLGMAS